MTRRRVLRESRLAHLGVGALMLIIPASAAALVTKSSSLAGTGGVAAIQSQRSAQAQTARKPHKVHVRSRTFNVLSGQAIGLRGRVAPSLPWRRVRLEGRRGGRWVTLANSQTGSRGGFAVRYVARDLANERLRVVVGGGHGAPSASAPAGKLIVYREAVASWYDDGGGTACGFHAHYGVASPSMPCGSAVTFRLGGRAVTAVVDDRGPYVSGRQWDLNQNTAGALSFDGVQTVWSSA